jgi:hypothetical protein
MGESDRLGGTRQLRNGWRSAYVRGTAAEALDGGLR